MRVLTSGQVERQKRWAARLARRCFAVAVLSVAALFVVAWTPWYWMVGLLCCVVICSVLTSAFAGLRAAQLGGMGALFNAGYCPLCVHRVVEAWRVSGRGVRCPECGEMQGVIEHGCRGCGYDLSGCPAVECELVTRMECARCKGVFVMEELPGGG